MSFIDILQLIQSRAEKIMTDKVNAIYTDKHLYARLASGLWEERELPPPIEPFQPLKEDTVIKDQQ